MTTKEANMTTKEANMTTKEANMTTKEDSMTTMKYKLTDQNYCTNGMKWGEGVTHRATGKGNKLCTDEVIHYYTHPLLAALFNPIHAHIKNPILWEFKGRSVAFDGLKGGVKEGTTIRQVSLPDITTAQRVRFAVYCALEVYHEENYIRWAQNWLSGKDMSRTAIYAAAYGAAASYAAYAADGAYADIHNVTSYLAYGAAAAYAAYTANAAYAAYYADGAIAYADVHITSSTAYAAYAAYAAQCAADGAIDLINLAERAIKEEK